MCSMDRTGYNAPRRVCHCLLFLCIDGAFRRIRRQKAAVLYIHQGELSSHWLSQLYKHPILISQLLPCPYLSLHVSPRCPGLYCPKTMRPPSHLPNHPPNLPASANVLTPQVADPWDAKVLSRVANIGRKSAITACMDIGKYDMVIEIASSSSCWKEPRLLRRNKGEENDLSDVEYS